MKKYLNLSIAFNVIFALIIAGFVFLLFRLGFLPPFESTFDETTQEVFKLEKVEITSYADNLKIPWAVAHIDDDTKIVTERTGSVRLIDNDELLDQSLLDLEVVSVGESGLMGVVLDSDFSQNNFVYFYHSYVNENNENKLKISRYTFKNNQLTDQKDILSNLPFGEVHSSGEIAFGPDGKLYITTGDIAIKELSQDPNSLAGKTLRINKDGSIPNDNPFIDDPDTKDAIWSLGHRNAQGIDWHPVTQEMYQAEHGPSGFDGGTGQDEVNWVRRGLNYGWPVISGTEEKKGLETPIIEYTPAIAPSSILFYDGDLIPELTNKLLVTGLRGQTILVLEVDGPKVTELGTLVDDTYGRIRDLSQGPDGAIYFTTSNTDGRGEERENDDHIYRIGR